MIPEEKNIAKQNTQIIVKNDEKPVPQYLTNKTKQKTQTVAQEKKLSANKKPITLEP